MPPPPVPLSPPRLTNNNMEERGFDHVPGVYGADEQRPSMERSGCGSLEETRIQYSTVRTVGCVVWLFLFTCPRVDAGQFG